MRSDTLNLWHAISARIAAFIATGMPIEQAHRTATGELEAQRQLDWEASRTKYLAHKSQYVLDAAQRVTADEKEIEGAELRRAVTKFKRAAQKVA